MKDEAKLESELAVAKYGRTFLNEVFSVMNRRMLDDGWKIFSSRDFGPYCAQFTAMFTAPDGETEYVAETMERGTSEDDAPVVLAARFIEGRASPVMANMLSRAGLRRPASPEEFLVRAAAFGVEGALAG